MFDFDRDFDRYLKPYWEGNTMYDESAFVLQNADGNIRPIRFLYTPKTLLKVTDSTLQVTYEEGRDYQFDGHQMTILPEGRISAMPYHDYYLEAPIEGKSFARRDGGYLAFAETVLMYPKQIALTYTHDERWYRYIPPAQGGSLSRTLGKLKRKEPVHILLFGDSISAGANATSKSGREPKMPPWIDLFVMGLKKRFGYDDIHAVNTSVGGKDAAWGLETVEENALAYKADLVILGFGMNNAGTPLDRFYELMKSLRMRLYEKDPAMDCILLATMLPNRELRGFWGYQSRQQSVLYEIAQEVNRTIVANMTEYHKALLETKEFYDMTGNNVNHPNDFLIRAYAQLMLRTMEET